MDIRADPLGVCNHRSTFIDARIGVNPLHPSTSKKTNPVDSSEKDMDCDPKISCSTGDVHGKVLQIAGSITGESTSTIWPNADSSSTALIPPEVSTLPKRSRSCNDLTETSATVARVYSQKSGAPRTRGANMSWTNNLRETDVDSHSSDSKSHKPPEVPHHCPNDNKMIKEEDYNPPQEMQDVKTHVVHDRFTKREKDETEPTQVLLGLSPTIQPIDEPRVSTAVSRTHIEMKKIKKEDDEVLLAVRCETLTGDVGTVIYTPDVVDEAGVLSHHVSLETPPCSFDVSEWSSFDWSSTVFTSQYHPPITCSGVDTSGYTDRSERHIDFRPKPTRSAASSSNSRDGSEDLNISAGPFVSALAKFNEIVPNCDSKKIRPNIDAMERFQRDPTKCLGNTLKGIKCCRSVSSQDQQVIRQLLTKLAARHFENTQICVDELLELIKMAVCPYQRGKVKRKVTLLVSTGPLEDDARVSAGPIVKEETVKVKVKEPPSRILISDGSRTTGERDAQAVFSPVVLSTPKITYWLRERPRTTLVYFPDYRPYQTKGARNSNVRDWVIKQAEKPLTPRELDTGYLYVYWNQASFGVFKIGYSYDVDERLRSWESKCKHTAEERYRSPHEVRNVKRLEGLVHAELKEYRVQEHGCHGCFKNHREWFKGVDFNTILESIEFWTKWIMKEDGPYEKVKSKWRLKEDAKKELPQLCNMLSVAKPEESKVKSITITARRHNLRPRMAKRSSSSRSRGYW